MNVYFIFLLLRKVLSSSFVMRLHMNTIFFKVMNIILSVYHCQKYKFRLCLVQSSCSSNRSEEGTNASPYGLLPRNQVS